MQQKTAIFAITLVFAALSLSGCRIDQDTHGDGKDVKIATPFGGMQVKTDHQDVLSGIGLPLYPGAVPVKKNSSNGDSNSGSADINMSFGSFQLKVKAAEYRSDDSPQQVFDFYKKALGRYGNVIQCRNDHPVGSPTRTNEGLTCEDNDSHSSGDSSSSDNSAANNNGSKNGVSPFDGSAKVQLKAGSKKHQHIVDINPDHGGAKFGLVSLDLPTDLGSGSRSDKDDKPEKDTKQ